MNTITQMQKGSPSRDEFKLKHKQLNKQLFGCDLDFVLIEKTPIPDIVAAIDYKKEGDQISFAEVICYNALLRRGIPVYIVKGDCDTGVFQVFIYEGGHHREPTSHIRLVQECGSWFEFQQWEVWLRSQFCMKYS